MSCEETIINECCKICENINEKVKLLTLLILKMKTENTLSNENNNDKIRKITNYISSDCDNIKDLFNGYDKMKTTINHVHAFTDYNKKYIDEI